MGHYHEFKEENKHFPECNNEESPEDLPHKRRVRQMLEERLERKRMRDEIDELDGEFDWDEINR